MDPSLFSTGVLVVVLLERMKLKVMKVERKKHLELQCFVLFHACNRVAF